MSDFNREVEERFIRYALIDTQSDEKSTTSPSTEKQYHLLRLLTDELRSIGARDVTLTKYGAVLGTIPGTANADGPTVALLAHVDTTPQFNGSNVKPIVHRSYAGGDIVLPDDPSVVLSPSQSPYLASKTGDDIITASGTTLLGADDKAGVAIVMTVARYLLQNPHLPHGPVRICFTPDEEIGRGVHRDLPDDLRTDVAYTLDGAELGEIVYETFSADKAHVRVQGVSIHPGQAKDKMVNALHLAAKIVDTLPHIRLTPETTAGREGFIHIYEMSGNAASADLHFILRDFELDELRRHGELLQQVCAAIQAAEPRARITCTITSQYRNMRYWLEKDMRPVELAREACRRLGIQPISKPTRGGTDGSRLTEQGVPTPNLFTGMQNIHGPREWVSVQDMARAAEMCVELLQLWSVSTRAPAAQRDGSAQLKAEAELVDWAG
ncbi:MAG: peptidase T [Bryobacterales bacterium]|nr:peptidase T [Bryobacterales bacterium]